MNNTYEIAIEKLLERKLPYNEVVELLNSLLDNKDINNFLNAYFASISFGFSILKDSYEVKELITKQIHKRLYCYFDASVKYKDRVKALDKAVELINKREKDNKILIEVCRNECNHLVLVNIKNVDLKLRIEEYFGCKKK